MTWEELMQEARILLVDDEPANVRLLERLLTQAGYRRITSVTDPRQVPRLLEQSEPDVILLDMHMPELDGLEIMQRVHDSVAPGSYLPILVITADATPEMKLRALLLGAKDFITKPINRLEVLLRIRILLETRFAFRALEDEASRLRAVVSALH